MRIRTWIKHLSSRLVHKEAETVGGYLKFGAFSGFEAQIEVVIL